MSCSGSSWTSMLISRISSRSRPVAGPGEVVLREGWPGFRVAACKTWSPPAEGRSRAPGEVTVREFRPHVVAYGEMLDALRDEGAFPVPPSKVELYAAIRRDARAGMSGRAIEKKYRVGRRTIVSAMASAWPEPRRQLPPRASKLDPFKPVIDEILTADLDAPRKQRHTITRIWHRLMDEHGMADVSYPVVRAYVAERKPQVRAEAGRGPAEVFVPQSHRPGDEAEVGFGEFVVRLAGADVKCFLFCLRLSFSGKAVHRASLSGGPGAFFA